MIIDFWDSDKGAGYSKPLTDISRITGKYRGEPADWVKKVSSGNIDKIELHWYEISERVRRLKLSIFRLNIPNKK